MKLIITLAILVVLASFLVNLGLHRRSLIAEKEQPLETTAELHHSQHHRHQGS